MELAARPFLGDKSRDPLFGFVDLFSLPAGVARSTGVAHMSLNLVIVVIFELGVAVGPAPPPR